MAIRNIRLEGDEILHKKSKEVDKIDERVEELVKDMIDTMHKYNGVGLAAVQVGVLKRIVVIDLYDDNGPIVLINPKIIKTVYWVVYMFVIKNKFAKIVRPAEVVADYTDLEGNLIRVKAKELLAQAICHELDHLDGQLFIDKIIPGTLEYVEPESGKDEK